MRRLILAGALLLLSACGFQLRGSHDLPASWQPLQIITQVNERGLIRQLRQLAQQHDIALGSGGAQLNLLQVNWDEEILSVDSRTRSNASELRLTLHYLIQAPGEEATQVQTLSLQRTLRLDADQESAAAQERRERQQELVRAAAEQLLAAVQRQAQRITP